MRRARRTELRRLWILDEVGCCMQKGVMSCSSGTGKKEPYRKIGTQGNCGLWKRLTIACRKKTRRATVAWCSENVVRKDWTRSQAKQGTPK
jgi:hypothetical protein